MNFRRTTANYETWLARHLTLLPAELKQKHELMRSAPFPFFRATYYRWAQLWPEICPDLQAAPIALAVGDLHVENFGTWRDSEGRLVWGVNDFDEVWPIPYTSDLVRLAASAEISGVGLKRAVAPILEGYRAALLAGGRPLVLAEDNLDLRQMAVARLKDPGKFWAKLDALPTWTGKVPKAARAAIVRQLPEPGAEYRIVHRVSGLGSLGRQRFAALAHSNGGLVAREAKALAPSACAWAQNRKNPAGALYQKLLDRAVRCPDPFVRLRGQWITRRLAPDCSRIELSDMPREGDGERLLFYMGWETANIHLGTSKPKLLLADLEKRKQNWLGRSAAAMVKALQTDWKEWRKD
ncbi:MAG: DUF2252 family protein [Bryobacterales bacterium]|nr:DUF2252 family protein [Bryobacterales bacterium]